MFTTWFDTDALFAELDAIRKQLRDHGLSPGWDGEFAPPGRAQLDEQDDRHVLRLDMPGVSADDLEIECTRNQLRIQAERRVEPPAGARVHHRERRSWRLHRTLNLSEHVDADQVSAELKDGVLTLTLPHRPETRPRRIAVSGG